MHVCTFLCMNKPKWKIFRWSKKKKKVTLESTTKNHTQYQSIERDKTFHFIFFFFLTMYTGLFYLSFLFFRGHTIDFYLLFLHCRILLHNNNNNDNRRLLHRLKYCCVRAFVAIWYVSCGPWDGLFRAVFVLSYDNNNNKSHDCLVSLELITEMWSKVYFK